MMKRFKACDVYSSVSIDGGDARPYYDESANVEISMDDIADRSDISEVFMKCVADEIRRLGARNVSCDPSLSNGIIVEIDDDDFDSKTLIDSAITIDATDFLDESDCLSFLREYADYMPKSFELTGSVDIEGFEEID
jgi:hypothetical protein